LSGSPYPMIDTETSRKLRSLGLSEIIDIIELMEKDPSYANLTSGQQLFGADAITIRLGR